MEKWEKPAQTPAERVREIRRKRALTQAELAEKAGCSTEGISKVERGERPLTNRMAEKLAIALGVRPGYLLCFNDYPTSTEETLYGLAEDKVKVDMRVHALRLLADLCGYTLEIPDLDKLSSITTLQEFSELEMEWCKIWKNGELLASCTRKRFELLALDCQELVEQRIKSYLREVREDG